MLNVKKLILPIALVIALSLGAGVLVGLGMGVKQGVKEQDVVHHQIQTIEDKILAVVVERNPQATIREFLDFPRVLLEEARTAGIDFAIILAMIDKESGFKPDAIGKAGEIGLMQILPSTAKLVADAKKIDYQPPVASRDGRYTALGSLADPKLNVKLGIAYLVDLKKKYGEMSATTLRAYNRNPDKAREHRPEDRYAEDVGLRLVTMIGKLR